MLMKGKSDIDSLRNQQVSSRLMELISQTPFA